MENNLISKRDGRMDSFGDNVACYLYANYPLFSEPKKWDYAVIVEVEKDQKTARINVVGEKGEEFASLISTIKDSTTELFNTCLYNSRETLTFLREYLPEKLKLPGRSFEDVEDLTKILKNI